MSHIPTPSGSAPTGSGGRGNNSPPPGFLQIRFQATTGGSASDSNFWYFCDLRKADLASFDGGCRGKQWVKSSSCSGGFDLQDGFGQ
ncbi:hypothetical protein ACFX2I_032781 [Malus domestica]